MYVVNHNPVFIFITRTEQANSRFKFYLQTQNILLYNTFKRTTEKCQFLLLLVYKRNVESNKTLCT